MSCVCSGEEPKRSHRRARPWRSLSWCGRWAVSASTGFLLVALSSCIRAGCDSPCLSSMTVIFRALYAHHQFHLSELVELSLLSSFCKSVSKKMLKSEKCSFQPSDSLRNFNVSFQNGPRFSGDRLTKWCWRRRQWISDARCRGIPHPQSGGKKMMQTYWEEGESNIHVPQTFKFQLLSNAGITPYYLEFVIWHYGEDLFPIMLVFGTTKPVPEPDEQVNPVCVDLST